LARASARRGDGKPQDATGQVLSRSSHQNHKERPIMIARGSRDEDHARHHIIRLQGLIARWNEDADTYRNVARGHAPATGWMLKEADSACRAVREAADLCDTLADNLPPGHELWSELLRVGTALDALGQSIAVSAEAMGPRIEQGREIAGLKYLVGELRKDAGLGAVSA
jgi:hypothetical protein